MDRISVIVVDDEQYSLEVLADMVSRMPEIRLINTFYSPKIALNFLIDNPEIDLIFLDIRLPEMTGFDFLKEL